MIVYHCRSAYRLEDGKFLEIVVDNIWRLQHNASRKHNTGALNMITNIVITIESCEFNAAAYHHTDCETGVVEQVYGLLLEEQGQLELSLNHQTLTRSKVLY